MIRAWRCRMRGSDLRAFTHTKHILGLSTPVMFDRCGNEFCTIGWFGQTFISSLPGKFGLNVLFLPYKRANAMDSQTADQTIKLAGLVTRDYCVLASISQFGSRNGTVWTNQDSSVSTVTSKNHHRLSDERSQISITTSPDNSLPAVETTAAAMFEIIMAEDRYETVNRVAYKDYTFIGVTQVRAVVYGGADAKLLIDPNVVLSAEEFVFSARVNDVVKDPTAERVTEKRYIKKGADLYQAVVITPRSSYISNKDFKRDDMFRTLAVGDTYHEDQQVWTVREKRVFYLETIGGIDFYGREILLF